MLTEHAVKAMRSTVQSDVADDGEFESVSVQLFVCGERIVLQNNLAKCRE